MKSYNSINKFWFVEIIKDVNDGNSHFHNNNWLQKMMKMGFIERTGYKTLSVTGKGRGYLALSKSWKR